MVFSLLGMAISFISASYGLMKMIRFGKVRTGGDSHQIRLNVEIQIQIKCDLDGI
jgi:murein endopeptidase